MAVMRAHVRCVRRVAMAERAGGIAPLVIRRYATCADADDCLAWVETHGYGRLAARR
jgi:hypothetical protein